MQGPLSPRTRGAVALLALTLLPLGSSALVLGGVEVRSALGETLDARIPVTLAAGESVDANCFTLVPAGGTSGAAVLSEALLRLTRTGSGDTILQVRSMAPVNEPAVAIRLRAACPGMTPLERTYEVLLDPRPAPRAAAAPPAPTATMRSAPGDTLEAFAQRVYPDQDAARARYLAALRELNPAYAGNDGKAPLPPGTLVAMPDLRDSGRERRPQPRTRAADASPPAKPAPPPRPRESQAPRAETPAAAAPAKPKTEPRPAPMPPVQAAAPRKSPVVHAPGAPFELRLSAAEVNLAPSRGLDDRRRAQLRERLHALDSDGQVAAMLSPRSGSKPPESRGADLQLKLAALPPSLAARAEPAKAEPPKAEASKPEAPKVEPPKAQAPQPEAPKVEPPKAEPPKPEPPKAEAPNPEPPKVEPPPPPPPPQAVAPKAEPPAAAAPPPAATPRAAAVEEPSWIPGVPDHWLLGGLAALIVLLLAAFTWRSRRRADAPVDVNAPTVLVDADEPVVEARTRRATPSEAAAAATRPELASDAGLSTRLPENSRELRRRYIEERFPEIANRTLVLDDPASVVKTARLFYEDRELHRAVELLQFCIEDRPQEVRTWLALFEIFRLERLTGEFADLARRFHQHHGGSDYWRKVQYFGREIDPSNVLYREDSINTLETIGPAQARALAAAASFDPIAENWLDAPMDFENEVLANELRQALMARANLTEQDLVANPMPALRSVQMFTVA